ncbi:MAG TPA: hypothetical protein V6D08_06990 [Candidatus Obscuribacterales bacterium]
MAASTAITVIPEHQAEDAIVGSMCVETTGWYRGQFGGANLVALSSPRHGGCCLTYDRSATRRPKRKWILSSWAVLLALAMTMGLASTAHADFGDPPPGQTAYHSHAIADRQLHGQIRSVARWLENYCTMNYKFPRDLDDVRYAKSQLVEVAPHNPFIGGDEEAGASVETIPNVGTAGAQLSPADDQRIQLQIDYGLSNYMLKEWTAHPPDGWEAPPGTITAVSNDRNMFVVWGAGADGRPIRDDITGQPVLVVGRWVGSQTSDESTDTSTDTSSSD